MTIRKPTSGNRTSRRGSRYIQRPRIEHEAARMIKILLLAAGRPYTPESVAQWIAEQAEAAWRIYDAKISREAEEEWNSTTIL